MIYSKVKGVTLNPNFFVDDLSKPCTSNAEVKLVGEVITKTLDELKLQAHPDKSGVLIFGKGGERFCEEMEADPPRVQNFNLTVKSEETYLGMIFSTIIVIKALSIICRFPVCFIILCRFPM